MKKTLHVLFGMHLLPRQILLLERDGAKPMDPMKMCGTIAAYRRNKETAV